MNGYYVIKQDGKILSISKNVITNEGKKLIAQNLSTLYNSWAGEIAIGAGTSTPLVSNTSLDFEYGRDVVRSISSAPLVPSSYIGSSTGGTIRLIAKATLNPDVSGTIYETGLFSNYGSSNPYDTPFFYTTATEGWSYKSTATAWGDLIDVSGGFSTTGRAGSDQIDLSKVTTVSNKKTLRYQYNANLSYIQPTDLIKLAVVTSATANTGATAATVRFYTDDSSYYTYQYTLTSIIYPGFNILSATKSNWTSGGTGNPSWDTINYIDVECDTTSVPQCTFIDSMRVDESAVNLANVLVSRSKLVDPVTKVQGAPLEIEYYLDVF